MVLDYNVDTWFLYCAHSLACALDLFALFMFSMLVLTLDYKRILANGPFLCAGELLTEKWHTLFIYNYIQCGGM